MSRVTVGDICDVSMGQAPPGSSYNDCGDGLPLIAGAGDFGVTTPMPSKYTNQPTRASQAGDIILCIRATIGDLNWSDREYCLGRGVAGLTPQRDRLEPSYLWHWLGSQKAQLASRGTGSTFKQIGRQAIENFPLPRPFPGLAEQKRIVAILNKADAIRLKRKQAIALTEELLHSTFLALVGPGAEGYEVWAQMPIEELAESRKGSIRSGPFGSALRHAEFVDSGIAVLGIDNAVKNRFEWAERRFITEEKYAELKRYTVFAGDVLITIMGTTGRSSVVPDNIQAAITTKHLATITLQRDVVEPEFLSHAIHMHPSLLQQIGSANRGAIMAGLNLGLIRKLKIPVPPIQAQQDFVNVLAQIRTLQGKLERSLPEDLFGSLSQRAFAGEL